MAGWKYLSVIKFIFHVYKFLGLIPFSIETNGGNVVFHNSKLASLYSYFVFVLNISLGIARFYQNLLSVSVGSMLGWMIWLAFNLSYSVSFLSVSFNKDTLFTIVHKIHLILTDNYINIDSVYICKTFIVQVSVSCLCGFFLNILGIISWGPIYYFTFTTISIGYVTLNLWEAFLIILLNTLQLSYYSLNQIIGDHSVPDNFSGFYHGGLVYGAKAQVDHSQTDSVVKVRSRLDKTGLDRIMDIHDSLTDVVDMIDSAFSLVMLVFVGCDFINLVMYTYNNIIYFITTRGREHNTIWLSLFYFLWFVGWLIKFLWLSTACNRLVNEANRTPVMIHKLLRQVDNPQLRRQLEEFSLQLLHRKVQLTAYDFFPLDYTLIYTIVGAVTMYLTIVVQFKLSYDN